jgi:ABC-2 type transport system permease protein
MNGVIGGALIQLRLFRRVPGNLLLFMVIPFFSLIFLSAARYRGHSFLGPRPILAPAIIGLWMISVVLAEMVVSLERAYGTLETAIAAPTNFATMLAGRVLTVTVCGLLAIPEALILARIAFGVSITVHHPVTLAITLLATAIATAGTATALTAVFLAFRGSQRYVNTLGYPFYIVAGVLVPVSFLPSWIRPVADVLYLHWSSDLIYDSLNRAAISNAPADIAITLLLGCASYAAGHLLISRVIDRLRRNGTLGLT